MLGKIEKLNSIFVHIFLEIIIKQSLLTINICRSRSIQHIYHGR